MMPMSHLARYILTQDGHLDDPICDKLVAAFDALREHQVRNGAGIRRGLEDSAWTEIDASRIMDASFRQFFLQRVQSALATYNAAVDLPIPLPDSGLLAPLILKRYRAASAERFQVHFDSIDRVSNRYLVFLWYLNDVAEGGETSFPGLDARIAARKGRLLMFPPYWMYQHEGRAPRIGDKYIASTYLVFPTA